MKKSYIKIIYFTYIATSYILHFTFSNNCRYIPVCFHRIIISFSETIIKGNVIRKLSIINSKSPQTRTSADIDGIPEINIIKMKMEPTRMSSSILLLVALVGHKPINPKPKWFNSTAHTKSGKVNFLLEDGDNN